MHIFKIYRDHLGYYASEPHFTGQERDHDIATTIAKLFKHINFEVSIPSYNVLLSFPNFDKDERNNVSKDINSIQVPLNKQNAYQLHFISQVTITFAKLSRTKNWPDNYQNDAIVNQDSNFPSKGKNYLLPLKNTIFVKLPALLK